MKFHSEAEMQTAFTRWARSASAAAWIAERTDGNVSAAFELKHVTCKGRKGSRACCTALRCASLLKVGEHEEMQADGLWRAVGGDVGKGKPCLAYKISDMSAGYKPFDCFVLGQGAGAWFVVGWSCPMAAGARVYAVDVGTWRGAIAGAGSSRPVASVSEDVAALHGEAIVL